MDRTEDSQENVEKPSSTEGADAFIPLFDVDDREPRLSPVASPESHEAAPEPTGGSLPPQPVAEPLPSSPPLTSSLPLPSPIGEPAGFVRRALAFMIDILLINFLYLLLSLFGILGISLASGEAFLLSGSIQDIAAPFFAAAILLFTGYFAFFHAMEGQTPAKKILRIKVVRADGALLSHGISLLRGSLGYFLSFSFFGFGFLLSLFGRKKRALHDFLTGSYVVLSAD